MVKEMFPCVFWKVLKTENVLTIQAWTLHHPIFFELVRRDHCPAVRTGVCEDAHITV